MEFKKKELADLRENYGIATLLESDVDKNPFIQFQKWIETAIKEKIVDPNAMTLATVGADGQPSARTVLLKNYSSNGFVFFTNYDSKKGIQMAENERVTLLFWWKELERQVRIEGRAQKVSVEDSKFYFHARPKGSQISAFISPQSKPVIRESLEKSFLEMIEKYELIDKIPFPSDWGGYNIEPHLFEFWQGRPNRLHDRLQFTLDESKEWKIERLGP